MDVFFRQEERFSLPRARFSASLSRRKKEEKQGLFSSSNAFSLIRKNGEKIPRTERKDYAYSDSPVII